MRRADAQHASISAATRGSRLSQTTVLHYKLRLNFVPGVYISYPFCAQKCTYCNFASGVFPRALEREYISALAAEIKRHRFAWTPKPSTWAVELPDRWMLATSRCFSTWFRGGPGRRPRSKPRPGGITAEQARAWVDAGINRVSLGVQSFVEAEIARTGRKHTAAVVASRNGRCCAMPACPISTST